MRNERGWQARGRGRRLAGLMLVFFVAMAVSLGRAGSLQAQEPTADTWEQLTGAPGPIDHLFAPASGPLFAQAGLDLYRSDDGGATWGAANLPPAPSANATWRLIAVNPSSHQQIYATGAGGLYRTMDDAASWQLIWPTDPDVPSIAAIAGSPVAADLVYVLTRSQTGHIIRLLRSQDGGLTWVTVEQDGYEGLACEWSVYLLLAHPTDADRVFRSVDCHHGLSGSVLQESRDRGASWTVLVDAGGTRPEAVQDPRGRPSPAPTPAPTPTPTGRVTVISPQERAIGTAGILAGGQGALPSRFYVVITKPDQGGGMSLLQTDDDGLTWVERLSYAGGGGMTPANDTRPNVTMTGLAVDPRTPDRLYAAFHEQVKGQPATDAVRTSTNGGQTWTDLGLGNPGQVSDLTLGIDGRNLYAATGAGVWRLGLGSTAP